MTTSDMTEWLDQDKRSWIVCESTDRWVTAVRRFAPDMMLPLLPSIVTCTADQVSDVLTTQQSKGNPAQQLTRFRSSLSRGMNPGRGTKAVILWEVGKASLLETCGRLPGLRINHPEILLIFAVTDLSNQEVQILAEFGVAIMVRHPEELPKLAGLIQGYFATSVQDLD